MLLGFEIPMIILQAALKILRGIFVWGLIGLYNDHVSVLWKYVYPIKYIYKIEIIDHVYPPRPYLSIPRFYCLPEPALGKPRITGRPCVYVWVYSGHIIHHYNGIWGTCAPGGHNMYHQGAKCTMVHKGDYIFWKILCLSVYICFKHLAISPLT